LAIHVAALAPALAEEGKLGFVVRDWFDAVYNSKFSDECPEGLATPNDEIWWRNLSPEDRARLTNNGLIQTLTRQTVATRRGPNQEDVCLVPWVVKEPPQRIVEGKYSYGANLDGTLDGQATAKSCTHQKFTGLDGTPGIDNQMYRLIGCHYGWRRGGGVDANAHEMRGTSGLGMILIEVTGVTDPRNSDNVTVTFYRSIDQFTVDGTGRPLPYSSYRIALEHGMPVYGDSLKGKIVDGVLTTARGDVHIPFYGHYNFMRTLMRDMGVTLKIAPDGATAKGMITGYFSLDDFLYYDGGMSGHTAAGDSCPAMWDMGHRLADGYPDPKTGECTMLSSAFEIGTYAAFVVHAGEHNPNKVAAR
jgi:hypothetical protein